MDTPLNRSYEELYKPTALTEVVLPDDHVERELQKYVAGRTRRPLILHGPYGTGKSTIARLLPYAMAPDFQSADCLWIKADGRKNLAQCVATIEAFAPLVSFNSHSLRAIIIDEVDNLTKNFQSSLKAHIDQYMSAVLFVLTTNHANKLDGGLKSRANNLLIAKSSPERWLPRMKWILDKEGAPMPSDDKLIAIAAASRGDGRQLLMDLQDFAIRSRSNLRPEPEAPIIPYPGSGVADQLT